MDDKNAIKLQLGTAQKPVTPILGRAELADNGVYIVRNRAFVGKYYAIVCPQCHKPLLVRAASAKPHKATCKACNTPIYFIGKDQPEITKGQQEDSPKENYTMDKAPSETVPYNTPNAKLVWGGFFHRKSYDILMTRKYYIGRYDDEIPSDIVIDDEYVSRRSVLIEVNSKPKPQNCEYKLTVLRASNPVLVNGVALKIGESTFLNYGDTIVVGNTTLTFKKKTE